jgi:inosine/xanthosine triphosphatase
VEGLTVEIVVGSQNIPKHQAVTNAFLKLYPGESLEIQGVSADSGVASHPTSVEESLEGAMNRVKHARELHPDADYYVGIEGGLLSLGDLAWEIGWVAVESSEGEVFTAPSAGLEVKGKVLEAIRAGRELNDILKEDFKIENAGGTNGFYGVVTDTL